MTPKQLQFRSWIRRVKKEFVCWEEQMEKAYQPLLQQAEAEKYKGLLEGIHIAIKEAGNILDKIQIDIDEKESEKEEVR
jgi:hypothetical protein